MAKIYDLTAKLTNERPKIKLSDELEFEVDDRKNTVLEIEAMMNSETINSLEAIDQALEKFLGKEVVEEINKLDLSIANYQTIFTTVMAAAMGEDVETVESRFQEV